MIREKVKKYWHWPILLSLAVLFFLGTASFNYLSQKTTSNGVGDFVKWASPDETANYLFTKLYTQENKLEIAEDYNLYAQDIIRPRSFRSDNGVLKPVSFLGMTLIYGKIGSFLGYKAIPFLTPFFGALGIIFFYLLVKKLFSRNTALVSAFLLASFPPYIYYSTRSMFHNVFFTVLFLGSLYFAVMMASKNKWRWQDWIYSCLAGCFLGFAIVTRTSELLWLAPFVFVLWIFNIKKVDIVKLLLFGASFFASILPTMYYNKILYGSFFLGGYADINNSLINIAQMSSDVVKSVSQSQFEHIKQFSDKIFNFIFHFGFHPRQSLKMFYYYFVQMFYWIFWPAVLGLSLALIISFFESRIWRKIPGIRRFCSQENKKSKTGIKVRIWLYLFLYFMISVILIFYYGSWKFNDNPDPNSYTIGNSYTRYWLPVYLGLIPFVGWLVVKITNLMSKTLQLRAIKKTFFVGLLRTLFLSYVVFISLLFVLWGSEEGLVFLKDRQIQSREQWNRVLQLTESNSVIVTQYHDKLFFPERKVIVGVFDDPQMIKLYYKLADYLPVYYYNFTFPQKDFNYLNARKLNSFGLRMKEIKKVTKDFTLYRLERLEVNGQ